MPTYAGFYHGPYDCPNYYERLDKNYPDTLYGTPPCQAYCRGGFHTARPASRDGRYGNRPYVSASRVLGSV
jgi:hypothetical protein